ncbi:MAG: TM0106 family RecB-like putative nuclease [Burkholderiales bacterium]|nr:TM0106 family RecB-like putative nuclease [Burkholderiales bacterium]MDR4518104.1 TM0106 family RecB-like putative nuclease [Nitrosomonas sp.]
MTDSQSNGKLIKPSDATSWVSCIRRTWLDMHQPTTYEPDSFGQLLFDAGLQHERRILTQLQAKHEVQQAKSFEHTQSLMHEGVSVIYQARLINQEEGLVGFPDFLIRHENGQYQAADAKLTQNENKKALHIQLGLYRRLLASNLPAIVFLGDGRTANLGDEVDALVDAFLQSMHRLSEQSEQPAVRYSHSRCRICPYFLHCRPQFEADEDISLLYGVHGRTAEYLAQAGIDTISRLAVLDAVNIPDVPHLTGQKKKQRVILQARSSLHDELFQLNHIVLPEGNWIHFDIEDNPLATTCDRHVYLWGLLAPPYTQNSFDYVWTDDDTQDYHGWLAFLEKMKHYRERYDSVIFAHYSNHERATIKKYAERYEMINHQTVQWLLGLQGEVSPLFDMQKPVLDNLVLPLLGYGLKDICKHPKLVNFQWENEESGSQWSIVQFNRFLEETDPGTRQRLKAEILAYNRDDVTATRRLELWLRDLSSKKDISL